MIVERAIPYLGIEDAIHARFPFAAANEDAVLGAVVHERVRDARIRRKRDHVAGSDIDLSRFAIWLDEPYRAASGQHIDDFFLRRVSVGEARSSVATSLALAR
ncbi:MAG TPA: hypothetical protein VFU23_07725 [Gemmatimonadales bacterium]|nr:hypothetical protein [Gemmatimonadales bacterium]